jgi:hypothetical protein
MFATPPPEGFAMSIAEKLRAAADVLLSDEGYEVAIDSMIDTKTSLGLPIDGSYPSDDFVQRLAADLYRASFRLRHTAAAA